MVCTSGGVTMRWQLPGRWAGAKASAFYAAEVARPPVLIAFDLLYVKGCDVSRPPLRDRRAGSRISSATPI